MLGEQMTVLAQDLSGVSHDVLGSLALGLVYDPQLEVLDPVIAPVTVSVVDVLVLGQRPAEPTPHHQSVLENVDTACYDEDIRRGFNLRVTAASIDLTRYAPAMPTNKTRRVARILISNPGCLYGDLSPTTAPALTDAGRRLPVRRRCDDAISPSHLMMLKKTRSMVLGKGGPFDALSATAGTQRRVNTVSVCEATIRRNEGAATTVTEDIRRSGDQLFVHS